MPARATTPLSERIIDDTWSGVSRHFRITPMVPGRFTIPPQEVIVTWADPDTNQPRRDVLRMAKVSNKDSHSVIQALIKQSRKLPKELYRTLTWDRGCEMAGHKSFT